MMHGLFVLLVFLTRAPLTVIWELLLWRLSETLGLTCLPLKLLLYFLLSCEDWTFRATMPSCPSNARAIISSKDQWPCTMAVRGLALCSIKYIVLKWINTQKGYQNSEDQGDSYPAELWYFNSNLTACALQVLCASVSLSELPLPGLAPKTFPLYP